MWRVGDGEIQLSSILDKDIVWVNEEEDGTRNKRREETQLSDSGNSVEIFYTYSNLAKRWQ